MCNTLCLDPTKQENGAGTLTTINKSKSRRRRERRRTSMMWASSANRALGRIPRGRPEGSARPSSVAPAEKPVGRVCPVQHQEAAPSTNGPSHRFYVPSAETFIHPEQITINQSQNQVDRYLYLTKEFIEKVQTGFISNPIPLIRVEIPVHDDNFPNLPQFVFGLPTGSNVVFYDQ